MSEPNPDDYPQWAKVPERRTYRHVGRCGGQTSVDGWILKVLCNPYGNAHSTMCARCGEYPSLKQVEWADTGETIAEFRQRMIDLIPKATRTRVGLGRTGLFLAGLAIGVAASYPFWTTRTILPPILGILGGCVVGFAAAALVFRLPRFVYHSYI